MSEFKSESPQLQAEGAHRVGIGRRRLLRAGLAAAPVVLAVSGRSAMAATCPVGLSPLTMASLDPDGNGDCIAASHQALVSNTLGKTPFTWKPNPAGQTFQPPYPWPVPPFSKYKGQAWNPSAYLTYKDIPSNNDCWKSGQKYNTVFTTSSDGRSFSRIMLDDNGSTTAWYFCVAYLNALAMPAGTYAMTVQEVISLAATGRLVPGGNQLTDGQIRAFLAQTWG